MPLLAAHFRHTSLPADVEQAAAAREAALWVAIGADATPEATAALARLVVEPWAVAVIESSRGATARVVEAAIADDRYVRRRGPVHLIAEDPGTLGPVGRSLSVFLLNGRDDASDPQAGTGLTYFDRERRKMNMLHELFKARPRVLVIVWDGRGSALDIVREQWGRDGFAPRLVVIDPGDAAGPAVDAWLADRPGASCDRCVCPIAEAADRLDQGLVTLLPDERLMVQIRRGRTAVNLDVTGCEPAEAPLTTRFDLIQSRHLVQRMPDELTDAELYGFFDGTANGWAAYGAALPWLRPSMKGTVEEVLTALETCQNHGADSNAILVLRGQSGAGCTTLARQIGYAAAAAGFPTLVARPGADVPSATETAQFLTRVGLAAAAGDTAPVGGETPFLIVFDADHWRGREEQAVAYLGEITQSGRSAVVMCVANDPLPAGFRGRGLDVIGDLEHDLTHTEALELGRHLEKFLAPRGRARTPAEWHEYWRKRTIAADGAPTFWVALSFWLRGQLETSGTLRGWIAKLVQAAPVPDATWQTVLEVAALSVDRKLLPEGLMEPGRGGEQMSAAKKELPALALFRSGIGRESGWGVAHELLGRQLLSAVYYDPAAMRRFGLPQTEDPSALRLALLARVAARPAIARRSYRDLANAFPVSILKLDDGRYELAPYWERVLAALDGMPNLYKDGSRTFLHHAAITRRRICITTQFFDLPPERRRELLAEAVRLIEMALLTDWTGPGDEPDLNLLNSLSLAYQNLHDVEQELGAPPARLDELRAKANETVRRAEGLSPRNSYVLETSARDWLQRAEQFPDQKAEAAAQALGYIYQAMQLPKAHERVNQLQNDARRAVGFLRDPAARRQVDRLIAADNPFGWLALAWQELVEGAGGRFPAHLSDCPPDALARARDALARVPAPNSVVLEFQYEVSVATDSWGFSDQLRVLDDLAGTDGRVPMQLRLERALLMHQVGRHNEGLEEFKAIRRTTKPVEGRPTLEFIVVPDRLAWLRAPRRGTGEPELLLCEARPLGTREGGRPYGRLRQMQDAEVPYNPREFHHLQVGRPFSCYVTFGHNGPFLKPTTGSRGRS